MNDSNAFARLVPGFDFLQSLTRTATQAAMPGGGFGNWIAPTLDPAELDKRISELRTVQYWLEQNAKLLATTIQALEVQRMTLATLKSMNVPVADVFKAARPAAAPAAGHTTTARSRAEARADAAGPQAGTAANAKVGADAPAAVDAMQWWGALTQQFSNIATQVMNDSAVRVEAGARAAADAVQVAADTSAAAKKPAARKSRRSTTRKA